MLDIWHKYVCIQHSSLSVLLAGSPSHLRLHWHGYPITLCIMKSVAAAAIYSILSVPPPQQNLLEACLSQTQSSDG